MGRYFILLLAGLVLVCTLSSCSAPVTTGADSRSQHTVFLKDMGNGVCHQLPGGLMWQIKESKKLSTLQEAEEYAARLEFAGYDDWRLPTRSECLMLSELLLLYKGDCPIKINKGHWVDDSNKGKPGFWEDYPLCGGSDLRWVKSKKGSVRAVRP